MSVLIKRGCELEVSRVVIINVSKRKVIKSSSVFELPYLERLGWDSDMIEARVYYKGKDTFTVFELSGSSGYRRRCWLACDNGSSESLWGLIMTTEEYLSLKTRLMSLAVV
jgi:hypothetical protein